MLIYKKSPLNLRRIDSASDSASDFASDSVSDSASDSANDSEKSVRVRVTEVGDFVTDGVGVAADWETGQEMIL